MDRSPLRDFIVGVFVLAGIGALAYLSISIGGFKWSAGGMRLTASFDETGDLTVRAPVEIAGVRVGEVSAITLDKDYRAKVEMNLDPKLQLSSDTRASIVTAGMLGDRYIELQPGGEDRILKNGDRITYTDSAVILERLIGQLVYGVTKSSSSDTKPATSGPAVSGPATSGPATKP